MTKTPRQRRKENNKRIILDATVDLVNSIGLENVSLREIAKEADYSPAALYKYFDSKAAIFLAVQERENQELIEMLSQIDDDLPPFQRLVELCLLYVDYSLNNPVFLNLINSLPSDRKTKQQPAPQKSPYTIYLQAVQVWVKDQQVQVSNSYGVEEITYALWAQVHGMATLQSNQLKKFETPFSETDRRTLEIFLKGLHTA